CQVDRLGRSEIRWKFGSVRRRILLMRVFQWFIFNCIPIRERGRKCSLAVGGMGKILNLKGGYSLVTLLTRVTRCVLTLLALMFGAGVWYSAANSRQTRAYQPKDSKLKDLLKERFTTLNELVLQMAKAYQSGRVSIERFHEAEQAVLRA